MPKLTRACHRHLLLANWRSVPFQVCETDRFVTGLEGDNGAGKTTTMAGFLTAIIPNLRLLSFPNIASDGAADSEEAGLWGRLGEDGSTSYTMIEWITPRGESVWAGVALARGTRPKIEVLHYFTIQFLGEIDPYATFPMKFGGKWIVPPTYKHMREHLTMQGAKVTTYPRLQDYMRALYDYGITPKPMQEQAEQARFYRLLASSMAGTSLGAIAKSELRNFLLNADPDVGNVVSKMRTCLGDTQRARREIENTQEKHDEIHGLFDAAWKMVSFAYFGALARFEQVNEAWLHQLKVARDLRKQHQNLLTERGVLIERLARLASQEAADDTTAQARKTSLDIARQAFSLRQQLADALQNLQATARNFAAESAARVKAESAETKANVEDRAARDEHTNISTQMGSLNHAIEALIGRVIRLRKAREVLAKARRVVDQHVNEHNAQELRAGFDERYQDLTKRALRTEADLADSKARKDAFDRLFRQLRTICNEDGLTVMDSEAHDRAVELDLKLRDMNGLAAQVPELDSARVNMNRLSQRQEQVRATASRLNIQNSRQLLDESALLREKIADLDAERDGKFDRKQILLSQEADASRKVNALEDADKAYRQRRELQQQLCALDKDFETITNRDYLEEARDNVNVRLVAALDNRREKENRLRALTEIIRRLRSGFGTIDQRVGSVAGHVEGYLLTGEFEDLDVEEAARTQARLGPWIEAIVVDDPESAARMAIDLPDRPENLHFVRSDFAAGQRIGVTLGDSEIVSEGVDGVGVRLSRHPDQPVLGRKAREADIERREKEKAEVESELASLRGYSGVLKRILELTEQLLALGQSVWHDDPSPALDEARARWFGIRTGLADLETALTKISADLGKLRERQKALDEIAAHSALLDQPTYRDEVLRVEDDLRTCRTAADWVKRFESPVREILEGLPILSRLPEPAEIEREAAALANIILERNAAAASSDALGALLTVAGDLAFTEDEKVHDEKSSVMKSLEVKLAAVTRRLETASAELTSARSAVDAARAKENDCNVAHQRAQDVHRTLSVSLESTGLQGTNEEVIAAEATYQEAQAALSKTQSEKATTNERKVTVETDIGHSESVVKGANDEVKQRYQNIRAERAVRREIHAAVAEHKLGGKIDTEINGQEVLQGRRMPTRSLFSEADRNQTLLFERLRAQPQVQQQLQELVVDDSEERRVIQAIQGWGCILSHIESRIPRNIASSDDPRIALKQMREKLAELHRTLADLETEMRASSSGLGAAITSRTLSVGHLINKLNSQLENVSFGSIRGVNIKKEQSDEMANMLLALKNGGDRSLFESDAPLDETLAKIYQHVNGGTIKGAELLDYRNYVILNVKVRRLNGTWDSTAGLSTGESIGVGAAILIMILRTWSEDLRRINGSGAGYCMQQILLDEANRLDHKALDTLTEFCQTMDVQALVAAPGLEEPRNGTVYSLVREIYNEREIVTYQGRRFGAWTGQATTV